MTIETERRERRPSLKLRGFKAITCDQNVMEELALSCRESF
jgi:hypothetical protein